MREEIPDHSSEQLGNRDISCPRQTLQRREVTTVYEQGEFNNLPAWHEVIALTWTSEDALARDHWSPFAQERGYLSILAGSEM